MNKSQLRIDIEHAINKNSAENGSDTPDFILAEYLISCLENFDRTIHARSQWYSHHCKIGGCDHKDIKDKALTNSTNSIILCDRCYLPTNNPSHPASGIILCDKCDGKI